MNSRKLSGLLLGVFTLSVSCDAVTFFKAKTSSATGCPGRRQSATTSSAAISKASGSTGCRGGR